MIVQVMIIKGLTIIKIDQIKNLILFMLRNKINHFDFNNEFFENINFLK